MAKVDFTKDPLSKADLTVTGGKGQVADIAPSGGGAQQERAPIYTVTGSSGFARVVEDPNQILPSAYKNEQSLYLKTDGTLSDKPSASVELNKKTGKITVHTNDVTLTKERADKMIDEMGLKTLSANYKANPNYAYPVSDDSDETRTVSEIIDTYNMPNEKGYNAVESYIQQYKNIDDTKYLIQQKHQQINEEGEVTPLELSDDDILNYYTNIQTLQTAKNTSVDKMTNDSRLVIGAPMAKEFGLAKLESWDEGSNSIGLKDFMENYYNRQNEDWEDRERKDTVTGSTNLGLYVQLEHLITGQSSETVNGSTIYTHRDDKTEGLASAIALYDFLTETDPVCSFWQGAGDIVSGALLGVGTTLVNIAETGATLLSLIGDAATGAIELINSKANNREFNKENLFSRALAERAGYGIEGTLFYDVSSGIRLGTTEALMKEVSKYNSAAATSYGVAQGLTELAAIILTGNVMADAATGALAKGAQLVAKASESMLNASNMGSGVYTMWQLTGNVKAAAGVTLNLLSQIMNMKGTVAAVSVLGESVGEAFIQHPDLVGQLLVSEELTPESRQTLWDVVGSNAIGYGIGATASKGLIGLSKTPNGMALNKNFNRVIWSVSSTVGDSVDAARVFFSKEDNIVDIINKGNPKKINARIAKRLLRAAKEVVLENTSPIEVLGKSSDELIEAVSKYDADLAKQLTVEDAVDRMATRGIATASMFLADENSALAGAYKSFQKSFDDLFDYTAKAGLKGAKIGEGKLFNDDVAKYINYRERLDILHAYKNAIENGYDVTEDLTKIDKEIGILAPKFEKVTGALNRVDPNIIKQADSFITENRNLWKAWTDFRIEKGLLDADEIAKLRESGKWDKDGTLYVGQQRLQEKRTHVLKRTDNLQDVNVLEKINSYNFGSDKEFVDPIFTFQNSLQTTAMKYDRIQVLNQFRGTDSISVLYTGDQIKLVQAVKAGKEPLQKGIQSSVDEGVNHLVDTGVVEDIVNKTSKKTATYVEGEVAKASFEALVDAQVEESIDAMYDYLTTGNSKVSGMVDELASNYAKGHEDIAKQYLYYETLNGSAEDFATKLKDRVRDELEGRGMGIDEADKISTELSDKVKQELKDRFDFNRAGLAQKAGAKNPLLNQEAWQKEIRDLAKDIGDAQSGRPNIVTVQNEFGEVEVLQCDPLLASFMNTTADVSNEIKTGVAGALQKLNYAWMRIFRFGTTGPNPVSWVNQFFRDFGNAWLVGGATETMAKNLDMLEDVFGSNMAYYTSQFSDEFIEAAKAKARTENKTLARIMAESEIGKEGFGAKTIAKQTEAESLKAYQRLKNAKYVDGDVDQTVLQKGFDKADNAMQKLDKVNNAREEWLRTRVYANAYADAIKQGKTISQAKTWAAFYASNATTNFSRATTFMAGMQNTIPYLRASINGTKSFWRLWQVDPVGVTGRIMGGLVIPMVGLMTISLSSEENREIYKNIKEYQKENSLAFVINGQPIFIPIPQEVATVIAPIRQIIEGINGVSTNTIGELMLSDILGLSPLDLSGFADLDSYKIYEDESIFDRLQGGLTVLASQCLPKYMNSVIALSTGRDLYTGNKLDTSYTTVDPDTGEPRVIDYETGQLANWLHGVFPSISASLASNILENTIGQVGTGLGNWIVDMVQSASGKQSWADTGTNIVKGLSGAATSPFIKYTVPDEANKAFKELISTAYDMRAEILASDEWQNYVKSTGSATSEQKLNALAVQRQNIVEPYFEKIKSMLDAYQNNYGVGLTQAQVASVISVMVLHQGGATGNPVLDASQNSESYYAARSSAVATMQKFGFPETGAQDAIFGRLRTNSKTGEVYVEYNNPLAVLDFQQSQKMSYNLYPAEVEAIIKDAGLPTAIKDVKEQISDTYNDKSLSYKQASAKRDNIRAEWNKKVVKALDPYMQQYTPQAVLDNYDVMNYLEGFILVPESAMGKATRTSSKEGVGWSKQYAFAYNYIKSIYGVK